MNDVLMIGAVLLLFVIGFFMVRRMEKYFTKRDFYKNKKDDGRR